MYMILPVLPSIGPIQRTTGLAFATKKNETDQLVELPGTGGLHHRYEWQAAA
jgi:hypothetical protein